MIISKEQNESINLIISKSISLNLKQPNKKICVRQASRSSQRKTYSYNYVKSKMDLQEQNKKVLEFYQNFD
jgi:hypothetical protein